MKTDKSERFNTIITALLILTGVALIGHAFLRNSKIWEKSPTTPDDQQVTTAAPEKCPSGTVEQTIKDNYLRDIVRKGQNVKIQVGYYKCNPFQPGDLIALRPFSNSEPVIRIVRAIPGDKIKVSPDKERGRWNLSVNGEILRYENKPYFFGRLDQKFPLHKYIEERGSEVAENHAVVMSLIPPGLYDSSDLGVVGPDLIVGRAEISKE